MASNPETVKVNHPDLEGEILIINREDYDKNKYGEIVTGRKPLKDVAIEPVDITAETIGNAKAKDVIALVSGFDAESDDDKARALVLLDAESTGKGRATITDALENFINGQYQ